jgi:hypothetical protein
MGLVKPNVIRQAGYVACISDIMNAYKITFRKPERCGLNKTKFPGQVLMKIVMTHWIS